VKEQKRKQLKQNKINHFTNIEIIIHQFETVFFSSVCVGPKGRRFWRSVFDIFLCKKKKENSLISRQILKWRRRVAV